MDIVTPPVEDNYHHPDQRWKRKNARAKAIYVLEQRTKGRLFKDIAADLDIPEQYACSLYHKQMKKVIPEKVDQIRRIEDRRLDYVLNEAWKILDSEHLLIQQGRVVMVPLLHEGFPVKDETGELIFVPAKDNGPKLAAIATILKISERRGKLWGTDAPTKTALTDPTGEKEATPIALSLEQLMEEAQRRGLPTKIFQE